MSDIFWRYVFRRRGEATWSDVVLCGFGLAIENAQILWNASDASCVCDASRRICASVILRPRCRACGDGVSSAEMLDLCSSPAYSAPGVSLYSDFYASDSAILVIFPFVSSSSYAAHRLLYHRHVFAGLQDAASRPR